MPKPNGVISETEVAGIGRKEGYLLAKSLEAIYVALVNYADQRDELVMSMVESLAVQVTDIITDVVTYATYVVVVLLVLIVIMFVQIKRLAERLSHAEDHIEALYDKHFYLKSDVLKLHKDDVS
jgi:hypothetical protein